MTLADVSKGRNNNLNVIRLFAAILVVFSHSFPISYGQEYPDMASTFSNGQTSFGNIAVCIFFFFGGFLIMGSAQRSTSAKDFFQKRVVRLFPSLIVVVLVSVFILGAVLTNVGILSYFTNTKTYMYLFNALLIPVHDLPGVFINNIYGQTVNGPLWTLPIEFICYVICFAMFSLHFTDEKKMKYSIVFFIPGYILLFYLVRGNAVLTTALRPMGMFYVGMLYYVYRDRIKMNPWICLTAFMLFIASLRINFLEYTVLLTLPYILAYIGFAYKNIHLQKNKTDISYQLYLVAWPIQQIVCQLFGGKMNSYMNFMISLPVGIFVGWLLYKCVARIKI